jgi:tRNA uridine 5-carboxymethylaminomethyl modification enzyme
LPRDVQRRVVRGIRGLERAEIVRYGYAVEYDFVPSGQVDITLESRAVEGLYLAGQINGTSGYEEAAAQGLMAGINVAAKQRGLPPFVLQRSEAYIGVLLDDLVRLSLQEPYRMFTSRAEFRLHLRCDNADERLLPHAERYGLLDAPLQGYAQRMGRAEEQVAALRGRKLDRKAVLELAAARNISVGSGPHTLERLLKVGLRMADLQELLPELQHVEAGVVEKLEVRTRYAGYVARQERQVRAARKLEGWRIPGDLDYRGIRGLSAEASQKLRDRRPHTLGQAGRIDGVRAADVALLLVHLERRRREDPESRRPSLEASS